jgi:hypothetical protein
MFGAEISGGTLWCDQLWNCLKRMKKKKMILFAAEILELFVVM